MITWHGRTRSLFVGHDYDWFLKVELPEGCTPWNSDTFEFNGGWHPPVDIWLPHPPIRRRKK